MGGMPLQLSSSQAISGFIFASLLLPCACTNDSFTSPDTSTVERAEWDFGAVDFASTGGGAGGVGGDEPTGDIVMLDDFEAAVDDFTQFVGACGTFRAGSFSFGRFRSSPYRTHLLNCISQSAVCATQREYLCADYPEEWQECFRKFETFSCDDGELIVGAYQCDTILDCKDGEDERNCQDLWYQCADGSPVLQSDRCDKQVDCPDASDEHDCEFDFFLCDNDKGIPSWNVCDGVKDCADGSDEDDGCAKVTCN